MGLLDFIAKPMEDVVNAVEGAVTQPKQHAKQNGAISTNPTVQNVVNNQLPAIKTLQQGGVSALGNQIAQNVTSGNTQVEPMLGVGDIDTDVNPQIFDTKDDPISSKPNEQTGGQYINPDKRPLTGGTPTQVKKMQLPPIRMNYAAPKPGDLSTPTDQQLPNIGVQQTQTDAQSAQQTSQMPQNKYKAQAMQNRQAYAKQNAISTSGSDIKANQNRNFGLDDQIKTDQDVQRVNATLNRNGIKGSAIQQKQLQESAISDLGDKAESQIKSDYNKDPQKYSTSADDLRNEIYVNTVNNPSFSEIPSTQLQAQIDGYLSRVYARATGNTGITNRSTIPDNIPDPIVYKMKQLMNTDVSSFYDKDPTKLNPDQQISSYARDSLDDIIDAKHPEASGFNSDQADMFRANGQLSKNYNKELGQSNQQAQQPWYKRGKTAGIAGGVTAALISPFYYQALKNMGLDPAKLIGGGIAGVEDIFNKQGNQPSKGYQGQEQYNQQTDNKYYANQSHITSSSIPRTQADVKPDAYGNWPVANPENIYDSSNNPVIMDRSTYNALDYTAKQKVNKDVALGLTGTPQYAQDLTDKQNLEDRWNNQGTINDNYNKASNVSSLVGKVKNEAQGLSDSLLRQTTFDQLSSINNGQYRQLHSDIADLAKAWNVDPNLIWTQQDTQALNGNLDSIGQNNAYKWNQYINQQTGNNGPSNLTNTQIQQPTINNPQVQSAQPQGKVQIFNGGSSAGTQLPPMPNFQQIGSQF